MGLVLNERYFLALFRFNTNLYLKGQKILKKYQKIQKIPKLEIWPAQQGFHLGTVSSECRGWGPKARRCNSGHNNGGHLPLHAILSNHCHEPTNTVLSCF